MAGWLKIHTAVWAGNPAGSAVQGYLTLALKKVAGPHPDVSHWYGWLIEHVALPHVTILSNIVAYGEFLVGVALIVGLFTGIAAFFGSFMNMNYLFAGTVSVNPLLLLLQLFLILAWRTAGWVGLDKFVLPALGTPWQPGEMFEKK